MSGGQNQPGQRGIDFAAIQAEHPIAETIGRYLELKRQGGEYKARCPFHNDSSPSFCVVPKKGKAFCMSCGWHGDVIDFVAQFEGIDTAAAARRLSGNDLPTERPKLPDLPPDEADEWTPVMPVPASAPPYDPAVTYNPRRAKSVNWSRIITRQDPYRDAGGQLLGYVVRLEIDGEKLTPTVTWCRHADGRELWASVKFPTPRPLQGLDELAARPQAPVLVVSGEKCREAAAAILSGFAVVTWPGGDNNVDKADWTPLRGRTATFWPDADESGITAALDAARLSCAHTARILTVDDLRAEFGKGADVADLVAAGWTTMRVVEWAKKRVQPIELAPVQTEPSAAATHASDEAAAGSASGPGGGTATGRGETPGKPNQAADVNPRTAERPPATDIAPSVGEVLPAKIRADLDTAADPDADGLPEMYSEDNVALRFSQIYADDLRYVAPWGRWMRWSGQRWMHEDTLEVFDFARKVCRSVAAYVKTDVQLTPKQQQTVATRYGTAQTVASVERLAKADRRHAATISQWDSDIWALNTPAGVVDLRTGRVTSGSRHSYMTKITRAAPGGSCPNWLCFLDVATGGDADLVAFLRRMAGYTLTGSTRDHALFFVYGTGGNGKGTFLNTLQWILGDYAKAAAMDVFTERKHDSHPTELAGLMGARLVTAQETEEGKRWAEARIKALTGGDPITARFMRQDNFEFIPQFKLVIAGNHKPGLRNVDEAIKRRLHLIPFTVTIAPADRDVRLPEKLQAEAPGILQWAIDGCLEWQNRGLLPPSAVIAATAEYLEQEDQFVNWIADCCETGSAFAHAAKPLYASYKAWAERAGEFAVPQKRWAQQMLTRGFESKRGKAGIMYQGIRVQYDENGRGPNDW